MNMPTFAEYLKGKGRLEGRTEGAANVIKALEELNYPKSDIEKIIAKSRQIEASKEQQRPDM